MPGTDNYWLLYFTIIGFWSMQVIIAVDELWSFCSFIDMKQSLAVLEVRTMKC